MTNTYRQTIVLLTIAVLVAAATILTQPTQPQCYEDEVIVWSGTTDSHSRCVPLDDLR